MLRFNFVAVHFPATELAVAGVQVEAVVAGDERKRPGCVGAEFIGGATDTFDAWKSGKLPGLLAKHGVKHAGDLKGDPYSFLPNWLQPR